MNLLLTNLCNGKCPYCFAADTMYGKEGREREHEISLENLSVVLDYLSRSQPDQEIRLLGGEPTKHSRLEEVLSLIVRKGFRKIVIFSNGIIDAKTADVLKKFRECLVFVWNVNPPGLYPEKLDEMIRTSVRELSTPESSVGFNIYHTGYDLAFALEFLRENPHVRRVRIGIAHPMGTESPTAPQKAVYVKDYPKIGLTIRDFVRSLAGDPAFSHIESAVLDCGYAPCLWSGEDYAELKGYGFFDMQEKHSGCHAEITDFTTELQVRPCFTKAEGQTPIRRIFDFHTVEQAVQYNADQYWISRKFLPPASQKCVTCEDRERCFGGCGGERMLQAKLRMAKAEFRLKSASRQDRADVFFELATLSAACYDYEKAVRYAEDARAFLHPLRFFKRREVGNAAAVFRKILSGKGYADDRSGIGALKKDFVDDRKKGVFNKNLFSAYTATLVNAVFDWRFSERKGFSERLANMESGEGAEWKKKEAEEYLRTAESVKFRKTDFWTLLGYSSVLRFVRGDEALLSHISEYFSKNPDAEPEFRQFVSELIPDGIIGDVTADLLKEHFSNRKS